MEILSILGQLALEFAIGTLGEAFLTIAVWLAGRVGRLGLALTALALMGSFGDKRGRLP